MNKFMIKLFFRTEKTSNNPLVIRIKPITKSYKVAPSNRFTLLVINDTEKLERYFGFSMKF